MRIIAGIWMLLCVGLAPAQISKQAKYDAKVLPDIVYQKVGDKELKIDVAMPAKGEGPFPAVLCVHGGAWRMGSRKDLTELIKLLADQGYVAASVQYRLIPDTPWPGQIEDCKTAVRWLRENADTYKIDPKRIGACGFSAGGHLVCLLGVTNAKHGFEGKEYAKQSSEVQCIVDYFGPTDLCVYGNDETAQNSVFVPMLGATFKDKPEAYKKASPMEYICKECPPLLAIHGTKDRLVPYDQSTVFVEKLTKAGATAKLITVQDADHGWGGDDAKKTTRDALDFLNKHLKETRK